MPVLETSRLRLRPFADSDVTALSAITEKPRVMRFIGRHGAPLTAEQTARTLTVFQESWRARGYGVWAVEHSGSGALIGWCGFFPLDGGPDVELAYLLDEPYWGRGFAPEAATAALAWAFRVYGFERLAAVTHQENTASRRVLEKLGWRFQGLRRAYDHDMASYVLTAREYTNLHGEPAG